ncbi:hypothetical protein EMGBD4_01230 [Verrucomicrobiota bacterium]|nr:hypothetical protein EMGBD4_01230 [Verrucomicrobiota bacterium]
MARPLSAGSLAARHLGSLFAIGNFLYAAVDPKRLTMAWILTAVTLVSGYVLLKVTQQLWLTVRPPRPARKPAPRAA